jgi:hypothetical protein
MLIIIDIILNHLFVTKKKFDLNFEGKFVDIISKRKLITWKTCINFCSLKLIQNYFIIFSKLLLSCNLMKIK